MNTLDIFLDDTRREFLAALQATMDDPNDSDAWSSAAQAQDTLEILRQNGIA